MTVIAGSVCFRFSACFRTFPLDDVYSGGAESPRGLQADYAQVLLIIAQN